MGCNYLSLPYIPTCYIHVLLHVWSLRWRHNDYDGVSNHQPHGCLLNRLFRRRSKKTSKLRVTGLCVGNSPGPVNSPHKGPVTRKMFPFDDVIMVIVWLLVASGFIRWNTTCLKCCSIKKRLSNGDITIWLRYQTQSTRMLNYTNEYQCTGDTIISTLHNSDLTGARWQPSVTPLFVQKLARADNKGTSTLRTSGLWMQEASPSHDVITSQQGVVLLIYLGPSFNKNIEGGKEMFVPSVETTRSNLLTTMHSAVLMSLKQQMYLNIYIYMYIYIYKERGREVLWCLAALGPISI